MEINQFQIKDIEKVREVDKSEIHLSFLIGKYKIFKTLPQLIPSNLMFHKLSPASLAHIEEHENMKVIMKQYYILKSYYIENM